MTTIELTDGTTIRTDDPRTVRGRTRCFVLEAPTRDFARRALATARPPRGPATEIRGLRRA